MVPENIVWTTCCEKNNTYSLFSNQTPVLVEAGVLIFMNLKLTITYTVSIWYFN